MLWTAQFASDIGTWAQTVGAQWFLVSASGSAALIALVQTATSLPVVLLAVPAGVMADLIDRRRVLVVMQLMLTVVAAGLCLSAVFGVLTPAGLLIGTFLLGIGVAASTPAWQSLQPDVVEPELLPTAATLSSASINIGRSAGPAIGGLVVALVGPGWTFGLNAISYLAVVAAILRWRGSPMPARTRVAFRAAIRAGANHVRHSSAMSRIVLRGALWTLPGSVIWALLPVLAHRQLRLGSIGYGLLLASLGVGAVIGAFLIAPMRGRTPINRILAAAGLAFTVALLALARTKLPWLAVGLLMLSGVCWIWTLSTVNSSAQVLLPRWVRARGIGFIWVALQGGTAVGSVVWGAIATHFGAAVAFAVAAGGVALATVSLRWLGLPEQVPPSAGRPLPWLEPDAAIDPEAGPVQIDIAYEVAAERQGEFDGALAAVRKARLRNGAYRWASSTGTDGVTHERYELATIADLRELNNDRATESDVVAWEAASRIAAAEPVMSYEIRR